MPPALKSLQGHICCTLANRHWCSVTESSSRCTCSILLVGTCSTASQAGCMAGKCVPHSNKANVCTIRLSQGSYAVLACRQQTSQLRGPLHDRMHRTCPSEHHKQLADRSLSFEIIMSSSQVYCCSGLLDCARLLNTAHLTDRCTCCLAASTKELALPSRLLSLLGIICSSREKLVRSGKSSEKRSL